MAGYYATALVVFEREGTHVLSPLLGEFKHVFPIVRDPDSGAMMAYNWLSGRVELDYVGDDIKQVARHYEDQGLYVHWTWVDRTPVERFAWPMIINNCVGHTKQVLNFPSLAVTPCGLLRALKRREGADMMRSISLTLPGKQLISPDKPKAPKPPPPPPTMADAEQTAMRKRQRAAAAAATGAGGAVKNVGGQLGVSTSNASTATNVLLGG